MRWNDKQPIYQQLKEKLTTTILDGSYPEGEAIPSIRQVSADYQINPITVSKAYQELVNDGVLEKRRGLGMFVKTGASNKLLQLETKRFLKDEWPSVKAKIARLGLKLSELLK
jgi:GntR family transcriptional regulator